MPRSHISSFYFCPPHLSITWELHRLHLISPVFCKAANSKFSADATRPVSSPNGTRGPRSSTPRGWKTLRGIPVALHAHSYSNFDTDNRMHNKQSRMKKDKSNIVWRNFPPSGVVRPEFIAAKFPQNNVVPPNDMSYSSDRTYFPASITKWSHGRSRHVP